MNIASKRSYSRHVFTNKLSDTSSSDGDAAAVEFAAFVYRDWQGQLIHSAGDSPPDWKIKNPEIGEVRRLINQLLVLATNMQMEQRRIAENVAQTMIRLNNPTGRWVGAVFSYSTVALPNPQAEPSSSQVSEQNPDPERSQPSNPERLPTSSQGLPRESYYTWKQPEHSHANSNSWQFTPGLTLL